MRPTALLAESDTTARREVCLLVDQGPESNDERRPLDAEQIRQSIVLDLDREQACGGKLKMRDLGTKWP